MWRQLNDRPVASLNPQAPEFIPSVPSQAAFRPLPSTSNVNSGQSPAVRCSGVPDGRASRERVQNEVVEGRQVTQRQSKISREKTQERGAVPERHSGRESSHHGRNAHETVKDGGSTGGLHVASRSQGRIRRTSSGTPSNDSSGRAARDQTAQAQPGQAPRQGRPRNGNNQRRRRPREQCFDPPVGGCGNNDPPRPPRPKRAAARASEARASASSESIARHPSARADADSDARRRTGTGGKGRTAVACRSRNSSEVAPSRDPVVARLAEAASEAAPALPPSAGEGEASEAEEEAFPALPSAGGYRKAPGESSSPLPPPLGVAVSRPVGLDYSSLAERLSVEAAAAGMAAKPATASPGARDGAAGDDFSRLSVLPSYGDGRGGEANTETPGSAALAISFESRVLERSSPGSTGAGDGELCELTAQPLPPPSPSPQPTLAAPIAGKRRHAGAAVETVALRARLRERWFRLEATRKAQRQRESTERGLMAAEDRDALISGNENSDRGQPQPLRGPPAYNTRVTLSASAAAEAERAGSSSTPDVSGRSDDASAGAAREASVSSFPSRKVSTAGAAAIRRSETAAAAAAVQQPTESTTSTATQGHCSRGVSTVVSTTTAEAELDGATGPASRRRVNDKDDSELSEGDDESGSCSGGAPATAGERVYAACEAGVAGLLNELLVLSGGRAAEGKDKLRRTPLHLAAEAGSLECVSLLLKQGSRLDQRDRWRETPLHKAARSGNCGIVRALCAARMKVNVRNRHRETPLLLAVRADSADAVAALLGFGARLDEPDIHGVTPVVQAARSGQTELLMTMANSNQAWKSSNREGPAPYTMVAVTDPAHGARSNTTGKRRALPSPLPHGTRAGGRGNGDPVPALSPVHEAAAAGQAETLSLLLQLGISLEERDAAAGAGGGDTPLGRAVRAGQIDCARLLLDAGAMIGRENARGETPLVIAIRAGQASAVELLAQHGAILDGGKSHGRLTAADGRAPAGPREKMMARRRVQPLELALREGQLACATVLIEGGARISERALRAVKLEPAGVAATDKSGAQVKQVRYAGTSPGDTDRGGGGWNGNGAMGSAAAPTTTLPLQTDILQFLSPEIPEISDSAPADGGGLEYDPHNVPDELDGVSADIRGLWRGTGSEPCSAGETEAEKEARPRSPVEYVGGLTPALGECDVELILEDGSRLPAHSCLLAAFSGTFRDLFLRGGRRLRERVCMRCARCCSERRPVSEASTVAAATGSEEAVQRTRSRDVEHLLLAGGDPPSRGPVSEPQRQTSASTSEAAVAVAAFAAAAIAEQTDWRSPSVIGWGLGRGEVSVRFWGAGTVAAIVRHVYTGEPPSSAHMNGLGRLLVASVSLRMPRLMRQVEHLLSATLSPQKGKTRSVQQEEAARLLRAARVLRATDLEERCTLYMQANGVFPAVKKLRRELAVPSLHTSDVSRGLARLHSSGYLGSGPAHAWSSSGAPASATVAAAKRTVDLSLRKRAVDFDQLVPLLLDPVRCASTLSLGSEERAILLAAALADACPRGTAEAPPGQNRVPARLAAPQQRHRMPRGRCGCCFVPHCAGGSRTGDEQPAVALVSNFSAFSHGMGRLLRTGTVADVVLVLPERLGHSDMVEPATVGGVEESPKNARVLGKPDADDGVGMRSGEFGAPSVGHAAADCSTPGSPGGLVNTQGVGRPTNDSMEEQGTTKDRFQRDRFLAHSMVLASRSEKFAAMLRFMQRQESGNPTTEADSADAHSRGDHSSSDSDVPTGEDGKTRCASAKDGQASSSGGVKRSFGLGHKDDGDGEGPSHSLSGSRRRRPNRRRPRHDPAPRELELRSPLLSSQSLGLFLEFLYTGVLDPSLSTRELSELALIADEYLVPDLTRQAETLLVECLESRNAGGSLHGSSTGSSTTTGQPKEKEDTASTPLEVLQLGVSLGLPRLSATAARAVLLQLDRVSRSEAFEESGMSKRELVLAALEIVCS